MDVVLRWGVGHCGNASPNMGRPLFDSSALSRNPLVGKQDGCPAIGIAILAQTAGSREGHMRTRNEELPIHESGQQLLPRGYRRSRVDVEGNTDLRMFQLDALGMNDVTPEQYPLALRAEFITGMSWRMPGKGNSLDSFPDFIRAAECVPYIKAGKWHTFSSSDEIGEGIKTVSLPGHTPGHTGYEFSSKGQRILFWGETIHAQSVQLKHPEVSVAFDIDPAAAVATRKKLLPALVNGKLLIAGPHMAFPGAGRLRKDGNAYSWVPILFTDQGFPR